MKMMLELPKRTVRNGKKRKLLGGLISGGRPPRAARRKETARAGRVIIHKISAAERVTDEDMRRALDV
ncbi:MAG: hypothetical protein Q7S40_01030 [Opitutaceae bacterium]|nr:hypothetical protein [Opitutaceae bacterium]